MWTPEQVQALDQTRRTHPDPRVRYRAQALRLVVDGRSVSEVARLWRTKRDRVRAWRDRFLQAGVAGLADHRRTGRPPKLDSPALALLEAALGARPQAYGFIGTVWTVRDLQELLRQRGIIVGVSTLYRALTRLGYRYRRPRHDLKHRQDHEAVAAAREVLDWLKKSAPEAVEGFRWSMPMSVKSTPIPTWQRSGRRKATR